MPVINIGSGPDGPLASLELSTKYTTTAFPDDLTSSPYWIIFRAKRPYRVSNLVGNRARSSDNPILSTIGNIAHNVGSFINKIEKKANIELEIPSHSFALPIPSNLTTEYNARFETTGLGVAGNLVKNNAGALAGAFEGVSAPDVNLSSLGEIARSAVESGGALAQITENLSDTIRNSGTISGESLKGTLANLGLGLTGSQDLTTILAAALGNTVGAPALGAAIGAAAGNVGTGLAVGLQAARNPHLANVFTGIDFRTHSFSYKLIPDSEKESRIIRELIRNFKMHQAPDYKAGFGEHVFDYPSKFEIILNAGPYMFRFADSYLTNFRVNYTGEGNPLFFESTSAPYSTIIDMTFVETEIMTRDRIRQGY